VPATAARARGARARAQRKGKARAERQCHLRRDASRSAAAAGTGNQAESGDSRGGGRHRRAVVRSIRHRHGLNGTSGRSPHAGYDRVQRVVCRVHSRHRGRPRLREGRQRPQGRRHVQGQEVQYRWKVR